MVVILAGIAGFLAFAMAIWFSINWWSFGRPAKSPSDEDDPLLNRFMPDYLVVERQHIQVSAPASTTFAAARELDINRSAVIRTIFRAREILLHANGNGPAPHQPLIDELIDLGWRVLAGIPDREIVMGAATQPWESSVIFRPLTSREFAEFHEPGYVKIAWTLRADPCGAAGSIARTETRAIAYGRDARNRFRWYWACFAPGIMAIRKVALRMIKRGAEDRARRSRERIQAV